ncbi:MAG: cytochrome c family protein [Deltaproteobacteria bacterium]
MFDTMTTTKVIGGLCGTFLIFLMGNWVADGIYGGGEGHSGEGSEVAYVIGTGGEGGGAATEAAAPFDIMTLMAAADIPAGEKVFGKCKACHAVNDKNGTGPHLNGVIGRDIASVEGFAYSAALTSLEGNWTEQHFSEFLTDPKKYAPGTKMAIKLPKPEDRANLIAYLKSLGG